METPQKRRYGLFRHFCAYVTIFVPLGFIIQARWPQAGPVDAAVLAQDAYLERVCYELRNKIGVYRKSKAKNPNAKVCFRVAY